LGKKFNNFANRLENIDLMNEATESIIMKISPRTILAQVIGKKMNARINENQNLRGDLRRACISNLLISL
jgi:hypothetical protein